jgi:LytS/YehU family sensor histidine kinase
VLGRLQHRNTTLNKAITELKAKLEIEAIRYDMQLKVSKTISQLLAFSWIFFVHFVVVFWGNYYDACNENLS